MVLGEKKKNFLEINVKGGYFRGCFYYYIFKSLRFMKFWGAIEF